MGGTRNHFLHKTIWDSHDKIQHEGSEGEEEEEEERGSVLFLSGVM